jgi:phospholipase C
MIGASRAQMCQRPRPMNSRRDFLKQAALLTAGGYSGTIPASIQRALAIEPAVGSTFLDAEHIVILMQENRSFDHSYGTLRGVRGFDDPRAMTLPNGNPVWFQSNREGETYAPFRLNIKDTKATWMGSLPHGWRDQSLARNEGWHDHWLIHKAPDGKAYARYPLTLGYYNREDIPFYYALADAFTICDQNFCSSLTGTTPNRLHLWSGGIREQPTVKSKACVDNADADLDTLVSWKTFPERLEEAGVSWCVYQNELYVATGLDAEADSWLGNYGDNPLEYFTQYAPRFYPRHRRHLEKQLETLPDELTKLEAEPQPWSDELKKKVRTKRAQLEYARRGVKEWTEENFAKLPPFQQALFQKAFVTNERDPHFRELATLTYQDAAGEREMKAPKGDLFHQFREDVKTGKLPTVSWLVAPENFSDHPSAPWYGAWYVSETLDILTQNPEVWKKTIFILCYDENDGYFDHVPPFVPPHPERPETGKVSAGIDPSVEHTSGEHGHAGPIGLGYRVPLVIASPWSRGGYVCSEVFDHTSILQLLEKILTHKSGKPIRETNISQWRRTVCGDLTSVFRPWHGEKIDLPKPVERAPFLESIHQAKFRPVPNSFRKLQAGDIEQSRTAPEQCEWLPRQEPGTRPSCALTYELDCRGALSGDRKSFVIRFAAGREAFRERAAGAPFLVYSNPAVSSAANRAPQVRSYAVAAGDALQDQWPVSDGAWHFRVHGPNGFFREFRGTNEAPNLECTIEPVRNGDALTGDIVLKLLNREPSRPITAHIDDASYGAPRRIVALGVAGSTTAHAEIAIPLSENHGWYDLRVRIEGVAGFEQRHAGRIETGRESITDPTIGRT